MIYNFFPENATQRGIGFSPNFWEDSNSVNETICCSAAKRVGAHVIEMTAPKIGDFLTGEKILNLAAYIRKRTLRKLSCARKKAS